MKPTKIIISLMIICLGLASCKKYVDIKKNSTQALLETAEDCQLLLDNYTIMNTNYPSDAQASSDDYFLSTASYAAINTQENKDIYTWQGNAIRGSADPQWLKPYHVIYNVNLVIQALDKLKGGDASMIGNIKGSALFLRAFALWNVAQMYAKPFGATAAQDPGIPARTSPDLNDVFGRGSVQETYNRITQDLEEAVTLLNPTSSIASRPNKASAYAMLARVYLSMEDYGKALTNANASISLKGALVNYNNGISISSTTPFARFNPEVLFQAVINTSNTTVNPGSASGPVARVPAELYNLYAANDLRKVIFFKPNTITFKYPNPSFPDDRTKDLTGSGPDGTYRFTGNYEQATNAAQFNGLAIDEVYLIRAECYARTNKPAEARTDLNALLTARWKTGTYTPITSGTADEILAKIVEERRKELIMRSQRWTDLRRLNKDARFKKDIVRETREITAVGRTATDYTVFNTVSNTYTLSANDLRYVLLIPNEVIVNAGLAQNPR